MLYCVTRVIAEFYFTGGGVDCEMISIISVAGFEAVADSGFICADGRIYDLVNARSFIERSCCTAGKEQWCQAVDTGSIEAFKLECLDFAIVCFVRTN